MDPVIADNADTAAATTTNTTVPATESDVVEEKIEQLPPSILHALPDNFTLKPVPVVASADDDKPKEKDSPLEPWPPVDWQKKYTQDVSNKHAVYRLTNLAVHRLTRVRPPAPPETPDAVTKESTSSGDNDEKTIDAQEVSSIFITEKKAWRQFDPAKMHDSKYVCHPTPTCPGLIKTMQMHRETARAIALIGEHYGTCGIQLVPVPHPSLRDVWTIGVIMVFSGPEFYDEWDTKHCCLLCNRRNATRLCVCGTVYFCSSACRDRAIVEQVHTPMECDRMHGSELVKRSAVARERMIRFQRDMERDKQLGQQITVVEQQKALQLADDVKKSKITADLYFDRKRQFLKATSAKVRAEQGMPPDPNIPDELQVGGARHLEALSYGPRPDVGQNREPPPTTLPEPKQKLSQFKIDGDKPTPITAASAATTSATASTSDTATVKKEDLYARQ
jgi:hypothetical protein